MGASSDFERSKPAAWNTIVSAALRRRKPVLLVVVATLLIFRLLPKNFSIGAPLIDVTSSSKSPTFAPDFPQYIWQARMGDAIDPERWKPNIATWTGNNPTWQYQLLTDEAATAFVNENFAHRPAIIDFWKRLGPVILRADFIRYLAMLAKGGVYGDIDTSNLKPMSEWIPPKLRSETINAIIGIEYDDTTYALFVRPLCFSQWTVMSKPNHPLFETAVKRVMGNLDYLARLKRQELDNLTPNKAEVLQGTGPGMFTDAVMETLRDQTGLELTWQTFHDIREPTVYGDILILPINGFGSGQKHSHSSKREYGEAVIKHHFGKSWYTTAPAPAPAPVPADATEQKGKNDGDAKKG